MFDKNRQEANTLLYSLNHNTECGTRRNKQGGKEYSLINMRNSKFEIRAENLKKRYYRSTLFKDIGFHLATGNSLAITGPNGSGKSTLLKIIAKLISPTSGEVNYFREGVELSSGEIMKVAGFTSPLINPYDELTGLENVVFAHWIGDESRLKELFGIFGLAGDMKKKVKYYSSGMKQRLRCIIAMINNPPILILDEPGTNLDIQGKSILYDFLENARKETILIIATNDRDEEKICSGGISLG
ncbi:MAG: ATP-binding cassette domain-containing protein [Candidatus Thorarchaeota archaeon]